MTEILIYGVVGDSWDGLSSQTLVPLISAGDDALDIRINSPGGYVMEGLAIFNAIARETTKGRKVTTYIDGLAASMASVIAMAGSDIVIADNALMMIHNPWDVAVGDAAELRAAADKLDIIRDQLAKIYGKQTGIDAATLVDMMNVETWLTAEQALEQNFVTQIGEVSTASACNIEAFGFRHAPSNSRISAMAVLGKPKAAAAVVPPKETPMTEQVNTAATEKAAPIVPAITQSDVNAATASAVATERTRVAEIRSLAAKHRLLNDFSDELVNKGGSIEEARAAILDKLAEESDAASIGHNSAAVVTRDSRDKWLEGAANWLMIRAGVAPMVEKAAKARGDNVRIDAGEFRGVTMTDLARESLVRANAKAVSRDPQKLVADAFTISNISQTTGDFPVLLENTLHKIVQSAYAVTPDTWTRFCGTGSVTDFRDHNRYLLGTFGVLDTVNEADDFKNKPIPDGAKERIRATTKGNLLNLSRQAIINDDMNAFSTLAVALGRAAKLTVEVDVYALINSNPLMNDGIPLFHASHANLVGTGTPPTVAAVDAMRVMMGQQKDLSNNEFLDLRPDVALLPIGLGGALRVVNGSEYDPDTANKLQRFNVARGIFRDIVDTPRLTGTPWYVFADKDMAPAIEVAFLNGVQEPFLDSQQAWNSDGTEWKVRLDYGVGAVNYRSALKNPGA